jgi:outer membrane receptor for ferrienterochelin and colicins
VHKIARQFWLLRPAFQFWEVAALAILAGGAPVVAADRSPAAPGADLTELSLEELSSLKVQTVYGASRHEQEVTQAPSAVSIVTADDIKKSGYRTLSDILNGVRGFYTTYDRGYNFIGVRGVNRPGDYGGRILITVDGHRMNDPLYDSAFNGTEFILDVDLIDRVEVIRGPGSSLYGNNAFFAVINVITRRGRDFNGAEASGSYASYDTYTGRFSYGNRFTNGVELALSGTYLNSEGHDTLSYPEFSPVNHGIAEGLDGSQIGSGFASVSYRDFTLEGAYVERRKDLATAAYGGVFADPREFVMDERAFAELRFHHQFADDWEVMARAYYDHYRFEDRVPLPDPNHSEPTDPLYSGAITLNRDADKSESAGGELQVSKTFAEKHRLTAGAEYRHDFTLHLRNFDESPPAPVADTDLTADTVGVYTQGELGILDQLMLNAGVRYDYFSTFGDTVNPRAALIYNPWTNTTFKAIYGQAFRAPNANELYYVAPGYLANPTLKPERIHSYELVYEQVLHRGVRLTSSVFYDQINDLITFQTDAAGANVSFGNLAGATTKGGEMELEANWAEGWRGRVSYTYADARDSATDQRLSNSPKHLAKLNLTAPLWRQKVFANLEILGMSDRQTVQGNTAAAFCIANATLFSRELVKGLELSASVYNLFDKRYGDPVSNEFLQDTIEQDGRSFRVKLTCRF